MAKLFICIYKAKEKDPYLIATFGHLMCLTDDRSMHGDHIGLSPSISRAGSAVVVAREDKNALLKYAQEHRIPKDELFFIPLELGYTDEEGKFIVGGDKLIEIIEY